MLNSKSRILYAVVAFTLMFVFVPSALAAGPA